MMGPPPPEGQSSPERALRIGACSNFVRMRWNELELGWVKERDAERTFLNGSFLFKFFLFIWLGYASALVEAGGAIESYTIHL